MTSINEYNDIGEEKTVSTFGENSSLPRFEAVLPGSLHQWFDPTQKVLVGKG